MEKDSIRKKMIGVKINDTEKKIINNKANAHGLKPSTYMRNLALNYPVHSIVDNQAVENLLRAQADLGRLGGILKWWLMGDDTKSANFSNRRTYRDIDLLVDDIEVQREKMRGYAAKILRTVIK